MRPHRLADALVLLAPLPAVALGAAVARAHGISMTAFAPNLLAMLLGIALVLGCRAGGSGLRGREARTDARKPWTAWLPAAGAILIALTLLSPGIDGVHRWLVLGPVRLNVSTMVGPWLLAGVHAQAHRSPGRGLGLLAGLLALHVLQPDAAQATALALGGLVLIWRAPTVTWAMRAAGVILALALAGLAWSRPDPLLALDHVERVLALGFSHGPGFAAATALALTLLLAPMLVAIARGDAARSLALGFAAYLLATVAATFCGNFPVPVMGAGAGPVLGWYAMVAYLRRAAVPGPGATRAEL